MTTYYVDLDVRTDRPLTADELDHVLDTLTPHAAVLSVQGDRLGASLAVDVDEIADAYPAARAAISAAVPAEIAAVESVKVATEQARDREVAEPTIPELVGYAEIADIVGVSRQRARAFADLDDFPAAVVRTAAGPLRTRAAVESWAKHRRTAPGRPRRVDA